MTEIESAYDRLGQIWLGMGNIKAPCWFIGLEPGGTDGPHWPEIWQQRYGGAEVIDGQGDAGDPDHERWFGPDATLQTTWGPLIRCRLAYAGQPADDAACLAYQKGRFLCADGEEALLELSAYAPKSMAVYAPREKYLASRIERLKVLIAEHSPQIVVC